MARQFNPGQIQTGSLFNISASYALTASFINPLTQTVTINGALIQTGSHAEGQLTTANGPYSHAEGYGTITNGFASHTEGQSNVATGQASHAEGLGTTANGSFSHAEGYGTLTTGDYSHAEGLGTIAQGAYQHVQGQYNISSSAQGAFIVGNGTGPESLRSNLIFASGSQVQVTGSLMINDILQLSQRTTTPTAVEGMIIASGSVGASKVYYYNGTSWNALF